MRFLIMANNKIFFDSSKEIGILLDMDSIVEINTEPTIDSEGFFYVNTYNNHQYIIDEVFMKEIIEYFVERGGDVIEVNRFRVGKYNYGMKMEYKNYIDLETFEIDDSVISDMEDEISKNKHNHFFKYNIKHRHSDSIYEIDHDIADSIISNFKKTTK